MPPTKTKKKKNGRKLPPKPAGVSVKIAPRAYTIAQRIAKREQRTIIATIERAIVAYAEGGSK